MVTNEINHPNSSPIVAYGVRRSISMSTPSAKVCAVGRTCHNCADSPRTIEIGDKIVRRDVPPGFSPKCTHALIVATPDHCPGGIRKHVDNERVLGSNLLAIGLEGWAAGAALCS